MLNKREYLEIKMADGLVTDAPTEATLPGAKFQVMKNCYNELGSLKMKEGSINIGMTSGITIFGSITRSFKGVEYNFNGENTVAYGWGAIKRVNTDTLLDTMMLNGGVSNFWSDDGFTFDVVNYMFTKDSKPDTEATQCLVFTNGIDRLSLTEDALNLTNFGIDSGNVYTAYSGKIYTTQNLFEDKTDYAVANTGWLVKALNADILAAGPSGNGNILFIRNDGKTVQATNVSGAWGPVAISGDGLTLICNPTDGGRKPQFTTDGGTTYAETTGWDAGPIGGANCIPYVSLDGKIMIASSWDGQFSIQKTIDGGVTWENVNGSDIKSATLEPISIKGSTDGNNIFVLRYDQVGNNAALFLSKSTDRTANWSGIPTKDFSVTKVLQRPVLCVSQDGTLVTLAYGNITDGTLDIHTSEDGGVTWKSVQHISGSVTPQDMIMYGDNKTIIISRGASDVVYSIDKGTTWVVKPTNSPVSKMATSEENFLDLQSARYLDVFANSLLFCGVTENGVVKNNRVRITDKGKKYGFRNNYQDFPEDIIGTKKLRTKWYIFCKTAVHSMEQTGDEAVPFKVVYNVSKYTAFYNEGIEEIFDHLVYQANDYTIRAFNGDRAYDLSSGNKTLLKNTKLRQATWCPRVGFCVFTKETADNQLIVLKLGKMLNPAVEIGESYDFHTEEYPHIIKFVADASLRTLGSMVNPVGNGVMRTSMYETNVSTDVEFSVSYGGGIFTPVTTSMLATTGINYLGNGQKGFLENIMVFGKSSTTNGQVQVSVMLYPSGIIYTNTFTLVEEGFTMPIGSDCVAFKLTISNVGTGLKNITKLIGQFKNMKAY